VADCHLDTGRQHRAIAAHRLMLPNLDEPTVVPRIPQQLASRPRHPRRSFDMQLWIVHTPLIMPRFRAAHLPIWARETRPTHPPRSSPHRPRIQAKEPPHRSSLAKRHRELAKPSASIISCAAHPHPVARSHSVTMSEYTPQEPPQSAPRTQSADRPPPVPPQPP
jgi:hypothetical protein